jgi:hypothetical protein
MGLNLDLDQLEDESTPWIQAAFKMFIFKKRQ